MYKVVLGSKIFFFYVPVSYLSIWNCFIIRVVSRSSWNFQKLHSIENLGFNHSIEKRSNIFFCDLWNCVFTRNCTQFCITVKGKCGLSRANSPLTTFNYLTFLHKFIMVTGSKNQSQNYASKCWPCVLHCMYAA